MTSEDTLAAAVARADETRVMTLLRAQLDAGNPTAEILAECNRGMVELGERFAREECFLPDLMFGGMIMKNVLAELAVTPEDAQQEKSSGTVVMGTVEHDVHDIGKDIVVTMLRGVGFRVIDLGENVAAARFVEAIAEHRPAVAGMSVLLTTCYRSVTDTVEAIRQAGLRDDVSLMVGGAAASQLLCENAGCDFYGRTAVDGVKFAGRSATAR